MLGHLRSLSAAIGSAALAGAALVALPIGAASASTVDGVATLAHPGTSSYLASGGSTTQFTVSLPLAAHCDGDTSSHGYHVYSYLVPKGTDLSTVTFVNFPSTGYGLVEQSGTYYGPVNTAVSTGQVIGIPNDFEWAPLVTTDHLLSTLDGSNGQAPGGVWESGLVCADTTGHVADNWNTQVTFKASATDPNGFVWSAVPGPSGSAVAAITSLNHQTFVLHAAHTFTVTAKGNPAPVLSESGTLPTGVTFNATTGVLSGTATVLGSFPITLTATNGIGNPAVQNFTVKVVSPLSITTTSLKTPVRGTAYKVTLAAKGGTTPYKWSVSKGTLPTGLTLSKGVIQGTPTTAGTFPFTLKVTDASTPARTATRAYKLVVA
jgi:hypothetical protein